LYHILLYASRPDRARPSLKRAGKNGGGWGEEIFARELNKIEASPAAARSEQSQAKYSFPFRRKNGGARKSEIVKSILLGGER